MLQALSSNASPAASRPKLRALVFDRKSATSGDKSREKATPSKDKHKKEGGGAVKPRTLLSASCFELKSQSASIQEEVQLHLTNCYYIQVVRHPKEASHVHSVVRQHSVVDDNFREHPFLQNVFIVESSPKDNPRIFLYKMEKQKTLKQWLSKVAALKKEASEQLNSCFVNGGASHGEVFDQRASEEREIRFSKYSPELTQASRPSSEYSQGPGSPVPRTSLALPVVNKKRKSRTLERLGVGGGSSNGGGQWKKGGLFRRGTDSQIIVSSEEPAKLRDNPPVNISGSMNGLHRSNQLDMNTLRATSDRSVNNVREDDTVWLSPEHLQNKQLAESLARTSMAASLEDVILEEGVGLEGTGADREDLSDGDSDVASGIFSCSSSRCSSTRSFGKSTASRGSGVATGNKCTASRDRLCSSIAIVTNGSTPSEGLLVEGDMNGDVLVSDEGQGSHQPGFMRRAGEQVIGLLQMRSLRERGRSRRPRQYVRTCYSTSDLDHVILTNNPLPIPPDHAAALY